MPPEAIRVGRWARVHEQSVIIVLFVLFAILVLLAERRDRGSPPLGVADVVVVAVLAAFAGRFALMGVLPEETGIRVRNLLRTHRIPWSEIETIRMGTWRRIFFRTGMVDLRAGRTIPIMGVAGPNPVTRPNNRTAESLIDQLSNLLFIARRNGGRLPGDVRAG